MNIQKYFPNICPSLNIIEYLIGYKLFWIKLNWCIFNFWNMWKYISKCMNDRFLQLGRLINSDIYSHLTCWIRQSAILTVVACWNTIQVPNGEKSSSQSQISFQWYTGQIFINHFWQVCNISLVLIWLKAVLVRLKI